MIYILMLSIIIFFRYSDSQWKSLHSTVSEKSACTNYYSDKMLRFVCFSFKPITIVLSGAKAGIQQGCPCRTVSEWACFARGEASQPGIKLVKSQQKKRQELLAACIIHTRAPELFYCDVSKCLPIKNTVFCCRPFWHEIGGKHRWY